MLIQIREIKSVTLNIQTLGRIKRNPFLTDDTIFNKFYTYSNFENDEMKLYEELSRGDIFNEVKIIVTRFKDLKNKNKKQIIDDFLVLFSKENFSNKNIKELFLVEQQLNNSESINTIQGH